MSTVSVTFIQQDGKEVVVDAVVGDSLMLAGQGNDVEGILGECGGSCACATCHVYIEPEWRERIGPPEILEEMTLEGVSHITQENSRLGCQIVVSEEMDGLRIKVAPPQ